MIDEETKELHVTAAAEAKASDTLSPGFPIPYDSLFAFDPLKETIKWLANRNTELEARVALLEERKIPEVIE